MRLSLFIAFLSLNFSFISQEFKPEKWIGNYSGLMVLSSLGRESSEIMVDLEFSEVTKDSSWTYIMCYNNPSFGEIIKDYRIIKPVKSGPQDFQMDEQDGILIDMTFFNNCFYDLFEVGNSIYSTSMCLVEAGIKFEIFGGNLKEPSNSTTSRATEIDTATYVVNSFKPNFAQTVFLKKID